MNNTILFAISNFSSKLLSLISQPYLSYVLDGPDVMGVTKLMQQVANLLIPGGQSGRQLCHHPLRPGQNTG